MILFQSVVKPLDIQTNSEVVYLVTDNDKHIGNGLLLYANVLGVRMKKSPSFEDSSYWLDSTYKDNILKFDEDIKSVKTILERRGVVVFSPSLLGEELEKMAMVAPKTTGYIRERLEKVFNVRKQ